MTICDTGMRLRLRPRSTLAACPANRATHCVFNQFNLCPKVFKPC